MVVASRSDGREIRYVEGRARRGPIFMECIRRGERQIRMARRFGLKSPADGAPWDRVERETLAKITLDRAVALVKKRPQNTPRGEGNSKG